MTSALCVVHSLPSAIRLAEYIVPDAFCARAEMLSNDVQRDPNVILSAIDTTQTRIGLLLYATVRMNHRVANHSTRDSWVFTSLARSVERTRRQEDPA